MSDYDVVGARLGGRGLRGRIARPRTSGRRIVASRQRRQILGAGTAAAVAIGAPFTLVVTVQKPFQIERLVMSTTAGDGEVTIDDIKVGTKSQLAGNASAPIEAFRADAVDTELVFDPLPSGVDLEITGRLSGQAVAASDISAAAFGVASE